MKQKNIKLGNIQIVFCLIITLLYLFGCKSSNKESLPTVKQSVTSKGTRNFGLALNEVPTVNYDMAYKKAMEIGAREVTISLDWSVIEPKVGSYDDTLVSIINSYYADKEGEVTLIIRPLDTAGPRLPADLVGKSFNDPSVFTAFNNLLIHLNSLLSTLNQSGKLKRILIGNEIDSYLGNDSSKWSQWLSFYNNAKEKINLLWSSDVKVSCIIQFSALNNLETRQLYLNALPNLDIVTITYYPLNSDFTVQPVSVIAADFGMLVKLIDDKPIMFVECGYPSSEVNKSSEKLQSEFISAVFNAWDIYYDRITIIDFSWNYDISELTANQFVIDYGLANQINENEFKYYLLSLGLSNYDGTDKLAMTKLREELKMRVWEN